jgi:Dyp-type peroxidase family
MTTEHLPKNAQAGITERPPEHLIVTALTFNAANPVDCHTAAESLRGVVSAELHGTPADPSIETGELGYAEHHDTSDLMITFALSDSGYTKLGAAEDDRPIDLHPMPADILDGRQPEGGTAVNAGEGDVLLKIVSNDAYVTEHVLRRVQRDLSDDFTVLWAQTGLQRYDTYQISNPRHESRALIGFLDGTENLDPSQPDDRALIFTDSTITNYPQNPQSGQYGGANFPPLRDVPTGPEPAELDAGTYLAIEVLLIDTASFDQQPPDAQSNTIGRDKQSGAEIEPPSPVSHVQKANPDRPGTDDRSRQMLRRGYALIQPLGAELALGLVFIAFARSLTTQHEFVRRAWINNPDFPSVGVGTDGFLTTYVNRQLLAGGYYFVPPLTKITDRSSWLLPPSPSA